MITLEKVCRIDTLARRLRNATGPWKAWMLWCAWTGTRRQPRDYDSLCRQHLHDLAEAFGYRLEPLGYELEPWEPGQ